MMRSFVQRAALTCGVALGLIGTAPKSANAQKALVYCPVAVDAAGCNAVVSALTGPAYALGVDRGYDGTGGTVDLKAVDLFSYSVFIVPSLADNATEHPYALLRDSDVQEHLKAALIGRIAMWSGSPDQGATNRAMKDALIQNLAAWAGGAYATAKGPGLVSLLDASSSPVARYDWLRGIAPVPVTSDGVLQLYNSVRSLNTRGTTILTSGAGPIAYSNMATFGFQVPNGAAGVSLDAVGQTGTSQGGQVVLLTMEAGNASGATVRTDKNDYSPGETVTITGAGWESGESVRITLHMDPLRDADTELSATADGNGNIVNTEFAPAEYDVGVRFVMTAVGQTSGKRAQATFTDGNKVSFSLTATGAEVGPMGTVAPNVCFAAFVQERQGSNIDGGSHAARAVALSSTPSGATFYAGGACAGAAVTSVTIPANTSNVAFSMKFAASGSYNLVGDAAALSGSNDAAASIVVSGGNVAPTLTGVPASPVSIPELSLYTFDADATDPGAPPQTLTFSLVSAPAGAAINAASGVFTWTPNESQGPGSYTFTVRVSDGTANTDQSLTIDVAEVNSAPSITPIFDQTVAEGSVLSLTAIATDNDLPANTISFSLTGTVPSGAAITSGGAFTWTPNESQGPGTYTITVRATDNGAGSLFSETSFQVTVSEVNTAPSLTGVPATATIDELAELTFDANATDTDLPAQTLTFSLTSAPLGAAIDPTTGVFTWTPSEAQGPGTFTFTVVVSDGITPTSQSITVTVNEVNAAPVLAPIGNKTVDELTVLSFSASGSDVDVPAQTLAYSLVGAPAGASINASTGAFTWTPTEAQGPNSYTFTVRVSDGTDSDEESITVTVNEVNVAPELGAIGNKTVDEETALTFTATATDSDLPVNTLSFSLVGAPAGASINPTSGAFSWTPTEAQGPGSYTFSVRVTDNGTPSLSDERSVTVEVKEVNVAPVLAAISNKTVAEGALLSFSASATDADIPANTLTYSLTGTVPAGAAIDPSTGAFTWTPPDGPATVTITVRVTDNGSPVMFDEKSFTVTVTNVNPTALFVAPEGPFNEGTTFSISLSGASDVPTDQPTLKFSFDCGDGLGYRAPSATPNVTCPAIDNASQTVRGKVIDKDGGYTAYDDIVLVANVAPTLNAITFVPGDVIPLTTTLSASATFTDPGVNDTHTGTFAWGDNTTSAATVTGTNTAGAATGTHKYAASGVYTVTLTIRDKDGAEVSRMHQYVVVYDPNGGFVTGGGWIDSPTGAYTLNPSLTGKATFGFVSKYKKGQSTPDGSTEFQFQAAGFNFKSTSYEWLVVAGTKAQYKGSGTINGSGDYFFMLTATDMDLKGKPNGDTFRFKVWNKTTQQVIYDNQITSADTADPTTLLGGGSIQIHDK